MSIAQVQRWVISALIVSVTMFPLGALAATAHVRADDDRGGAVMLTVMMAVIGCSSVAAIRLVHRRSPWSPYLVLGTVAALSAAAWTWGM
jgi:hypothetical protein